MRKTLLAASMLAAFASVPALASGWDVIAVREVTDRVETDKVSLPGDRRFSQLKFCAFRHPVKIRDVDVYFRNGGHQDFDFGERVAVGDCTRTIDLNGDDRNVDYIVMRYEETSAKNRTATVRVLGR